MLITPNHDGVCTDQVEEEDDFPPEEEEMRRIAEVILTQGLWVAPTLTLTLTWY